MFTNFKQALLSMPTFLLAGEDFLQCFSSYDSEPA